MKETDMKFNEIKEMILQASKHFKGMRKIEDLENRLLNQRSYTLTPHTGAVISDFIAVYEVNGVVTVSTYFKELTTTRMVRDYLTKMIEDIYETAI